MTIGRQMYQGSYTRSTFHDEHGNEVVKDAAAEEMMWRNRASIWGTLPLLPQVPMQYLTNTSVSEGRTYLPFPMSRRGGSEDWYWPAVEVRPEWTESVTNSTIAEPSLCQHC